MRSWWSELQLAPGLVFADVYSFSIFGYKECHQFDWGIDHLVMSLCKSLFLKKSVSYDQYILLAEFS